MDRAIDHGPRKILSLEEVFCSRCATAVVVPSNSRTSFEMVLCGCKPFVPAQGFRSFVFFL